MLAVKNFNKFQHFKDRRPPWIKLYRDLLDDVEWHELEPKAAKALVMIWLIASENEGKLPEVKKLAFRLRLTDIETYRLLNSLKHWLEQDDAEVISTCHQPDTPETETERETEEETETETETPRAKRAAAPRPVETDEEWLTGLQANPAYEMLDVRRLHHKMLVWCQNSHKQPTRRRFVNWLNREDKPLQANGRPPKTGAAYVGKSSPEPVPDPAKLEAQMAEYIEQLIYLEDWIHLGHEYDNILERGGAKLEWEIRCVAYYELHKNEPATDEQMAELNASIEALAKR